MAADAPGHELDAIQPNPFQKHFFFDVDVYAAAAENVVPKGNRRRSRDSDERCVQEAFLLRRILGPRCNSSFRRDPWPTFRYKYFACILFTALPSNLYSPGWLDETVDYSGAKRSFADEGDATIPSSTNFSK